MAPVTLKKSRAVVVCCRLGLLLSAACITMQPAIAQDSGAESGDDEAIIVTGTMIRGIAPIGAPVVALGDEVIAKTGLTDVTSVLRSVPQVSSLGISSSTTGTTANGQGTNTTFASGVNIHGLGTQATLTLIEGHRGSPGGQFGNYFDPSNVPVIAVGRMEILTDGASATYGSDAMAGVVNIGLRRGFDGLEVRGSLSLADSYHGNTQSMIVGKKWSTGSVMIAGERTYTDRLMASERPDLFIADAPRVIAGSGTLPRGYTPFTVNPNIVTSSGTVYAGTYGATSIADFTADAQNAQGEWYNSTAMPELERYSLVGSFEQELTPGVELYGLGLFSRRTWDAQGHVSGSTTAVNSTLSVPSTNPYFIAGIPGATTSQTVQLSQAANLGAQIFSGTEKAWMASVGARVDLGSDWQIDIYGQKSGNKVYRDRYAQLYACGLTGGAGCVGALNETAPDRAFNPYGQNGESVIGTFSSITNQYSYYRSTMVAGKVDGPVFDLPGGSVRAALGADWRKDTEGQRNSNVMLGKTTPYTSSASSKSMNVKSAFVEVVVPVIGADNAGSFARRLDFSAAVRYSDYDILSESSTNPKFGLTWKPTDDLSISASYAKSFRVNLASTDKNNQPLLRIRSITDYLAPSGRANAIQRGGGNPGLTPETSTTFTTGFDWKPRAVPGLRLYASYFNIEYAGVIDTPGVAVLNGVTQSAEAIYSDYVMRRPSTVTPGADDSAFDAFVATLIADPNFSGSVSNVDLIVDARSQNAGVIKTDGIDLAASYDWDLGGGVMNVGLNGQIFLSYKRSLTPAGAMVSRLGQIDFPNNYALRGQVGWDNDNVSVTFFGNYQPSYTNTYTAPYQTIDSSFTVDATIAYTTGEAGGLLSNWRFALSAQNLFDAKPPYAEVFEQNFDSSVASMLGRVVTFSISKAF